MIQICIDKENILDLIYLYIQFIITYWGGQNILSPPIFLNGGVRYPPPPSDAPIYAVYGLKVILF